jgi:hypothetical protein
MQALMPRANSEHGMASQHLPPWGVIKSEGGKVAIVRRDHRSNQSLFSIPKSRLAIAQSKLQNNSNRIEFATLRRLPSTQEKTIANSNSSSAYNRSHARLDGEPTIC